MKLVNAREEGWLHRWSRAKVNAAIRGRDDLRPYQSGLMLPFLLEHPRSAAFVGMGLGKTVTILTLLDELFWRGELDKALIIAPLKVATQTWPVEIQEWQHICWMPYSLIRHDPSAPEVASAAKAARINEENVSKARTEVFREQRIAATQAEEFLHIINREQVSWLVDYWGKDWPYSTIVVDESTSFSDHTSQRWKKLASVAQKARRIHLLSGTPAPEGLTDLFAQVYLLDGGKRFGKHITSFRRRYMMQDPYTKRYTPQLGAVEIVTDLISDIALVMREEDFLDVKQPIVIERPILLEPDELKAYKKFERELILQLPDDVEVEAVNAGVLSSKLLQYASGYVYDQDKKAHVIHRHKLDEMRELREETKGRPLLVAYWFRESLVQLRKEFPKAVVMDREGNCIKAWNEGGIDMLLIHPQSAGHGIQLQQGPGHVLIFYDTPASLELYQQTIKRIARSGQKRVVRVIHLVARGTLDALAVGKLRGKESAQDAIINRLRKLRAKLKGKKA